MHDHHNAPDSPANGSETNSPKWPKAHPWRRPLLWVEFGALGVLLGSMFIMKHIAGPDGTVSPAWLLIPALASLAVFISFIALMYLRWVANLQSGATITPKLVFGLLTLTLLGIWAYGIARTWQSLP